MLGRIVVSSAVVLGLLSASGGAAAGRVEVTKGRFSEFAAGVDRGYDIRGPVRLKTGADWTQVRVNVKGLAPNTTYGSHLHDKACSDALGGPHYMDDPSGSPMPPNELWLSLETNGKGVAHDTSSAPWVVRDGARSVVIHDTDGMRLACADLTVD